uniref:Uncharacterized protein n=1 Tax=viral metagenome TaxID=1070528 RepID=A0A6C0JA69_9ZZZZ
MGFSTLGAKDKFAPENLSEKLLHGILKKMMPHPFVYKGR